MLLRLVLIVDAVRRAPPHPRCGPATNAVVFALFEEISGPREFVCAWITRVMGSSGWLGNVVFLLGGIVPHCRCAGIRRLVSVLGARAAACEVYALSVVYSVPRCDGRAPVAPQRVKPRLNRYRGPGRPRSRGFIQPRA